MKGASTDGDDKSKLCSRATEQGEALETQRMACSPTLVEASFSDFVEGQRETAPRDLAVNIELLQEKARELWRSRHWAASFMRRARFSLRRRTLVARTF